MVYNTGSVKSGCHDPQGVLMLYGSGIQQGHKLSECNNLDIAPTLLDLLGLRAPVAMQGRLLEEAFSERAAVAKV
jgi:predicted AlkP superfamily phosphohydrolase/phosphomutase